MIYLELRIQNEVRSVICPRCGHMTQIDNKVLKYRIKKIEHVENEADSVLYLTGQIKEVYDQGIFSYVLLDGETYYPVIASKRKEALNRIFLRPGYQINVSGKLKKHNVKKCILCEQCARKIYYCDNFYFVLENQSRLQIREYQEM